MAQLTKPTLDYMVDSTYEEYIKSTVEGKDNYYTNAECRNWFEFKDTKDKKHEFTDNDLKAFQLMEQTLFDLRNTEEFKELTKILNEDKFKKIKDDIETNELKSDEEQSSTGGSKRKYLKYRKRCNSNKYKKMKGGVRGRFEQKLAQQYGIRVVTVLKWLHASLLIVVMKNMLSTFFPTFLKCMELFGFDTPIKIFLIDGYDFMVTSTIDIISSSFVAAGQGVAASGRFAIRGGQFLYKVILSILAINVISPMIIGAIRYTGQLEAFRNETRFVLRTTAAIVVNIGTGINKSAIAVRTIFSAVYQRAERTTTTLRDILRILRENLIDPSVNFVTPITGFTFEYLCKITFKLLSITIRRETQANQLVNVMYEHSLLPQSINECTDPYVRSQVLMLAAGEAVTETTVFECIELVSALHDASVYVLRDEETHVLNPRDLRQNVDALRTNARSNLEFATLSAHSSFLLADAIEQTIPVLPAEQRTEDQIVAFKRRNSIRLQMAKIVHTFIQDATQQLPSQNINNQLRIMYEAIAKFEYFTQNYPNLIDELIIIGDAQAIMDAFKQPSIVIKGTTFNIDNSTVQPADDSRNTEGAAGAAEAVVGDKRTQLDIPERGIKRQRTVDLLNTFCRDLSPSSPSSVFPERGDAEEVVSSQETLLDDTESDGEPVAEGDSQSTHGEAEDRPPGGGRRSRKRNKRRKQKRSRRR